MTSLAGATGADAVAEASGFNNNLLNAVGRRPRAVDPATQAASAITQVIDGYEITSSMSGPPAPSLPTKAVSLSTPELIKLRALGKSKAMYMRAGEKKDFNLERDEVNGTSELVASAHRDTYRFLVKPCFDAAYAAPWHASM